MTAPRSDNHWRIRRLQRDIRQVERNVDRLVSRIETASSAAWQSLSLYARTKRLLSRTLGRAARHEHTALDLGRDLLRFEDEVTALDKRAEYLAWLCGDSVNGDLAEVKATLRKIQEAIDTWGTRADASDHEDEQDEANGD